MRNPLQSRRFLTLLLDVIVSIVLWAVAHFAAGSVEDVKFLIVTLQPIFIFLIGAYSFEDAQIAKRKDV